MGAAEEARLATFEIELNVTDRSLKKPLSKQ